MTLFVAGTRFVEADGTEWEVMEVTARGVMLRRGPRPDEGRCHTEEIRGLLTHEWKNIRHFAYESGWPTHTCYGALSRLQQRGVAECRTSRSCAHPITEWRLKA